MAYGMKHWIGTALFGAALISIWKLPPQSMTPRDEKVVSSQELQYDELSTEYRWTAEALRRVRWSDSLSALTVATVEQGVAVGLPSEDRLPTELAVELEAKIRGEVSELPRRRGEMAFGYFYQPFDHGRVAEMPYSARVRTETYVGSLDGDEYCLQVRVGSRNLSNAAIAMLEGTNTVPPVTGVAGACRPFLQYGMAGPLIMEWLKGGGIHLAVEQGEKLAESELLRRADRIDRLFGQNVIASGSRPIEVDQCRAGRVGACGRIFLAPATANPLAHRELEIVRRSPALSIGGAPLVRSIAYDEEYLLADLEAEFGSDAFMRFWTSDEDVDAAFVGAFGVTPGMWMTSWVESVAGVKPISPALPRSASSGSVLALGLLVGIAFLRNRRRTVL